MDSKKNICEQLTKDKDHLNNRITDLTNKINDFGQYHKPINEHNQQLSKANNDYKQLLEASKKKDEEIENLKNEIEKEKKENKQYKYKEYKTQNVIKELTTQREIEMKMFQYEISKLNNENNLCMNTINQEKSKFQMQHKEMTMVKEQLSQLVEEGNCLKKENEEFKFIIELIKKVSSTISDKNANVDNLLNNEENNQQDINNLNILDLINKKCGNYLTIQITEIFLYLLEFSKKYNFDSDKLEEFIKQEIRGIKLNYQQNSNLDGNLNHGIKQVVVPEYKSNAYTSETLTNDVNQINPSEEKRGIAFNPQNNLKIDTQTRLLLRISTNGQRTSTGVEKPYCDNIFIAQYFK